LISKEKPIKKSSIERYSSQPFDGLLGDTIHLQVLANLIAEPCKQYRIKDIVEQTESNPGTVSKVLRTLEELRFVEEVVPGAKHPVYRVNCESNKLMALTILALAIKDDRDGSELMNDTIMHYCKNILNADVRTVEFQTTTSPTIREDHINRTSEVKVPLHVRGGQA
jgi:hypothetical protein